MNKCFITGASKEVEWLLPWFIGNFQKHNTIEIIICDFGLSEKALKWCEKKNLKVQKVSGSKGWFYKPTALRAVSAKRKIWIDVDCEVLGDISDMFNYIEPNKLMTSIDRFHSWGCKYQTGVVGVEDDPNVLKEWEIKCKNPVGQYSRGDQELLWDLVKDREEMPISILPEKYNWLRMALVRGEDEKDKKVIHWTGESGKKIITQAIRQKKKSIDILLKLS